MIAARRRPGVFLLAVATMMFSLVLLSATSSGAQTEDEDGGESAEAATGDDECVEFGNETSNISTTNQDTSETSADTPTGTDEADATADDSTGDDATGDNSTSDDANATDEDTDTGGDTDTGTGTTRQDTGTGTDGEDLTTSQDDGTESDGTTSSLEDDGVGEEDECVVADTVPDKSLLPTGAPTEPRAGEKTAEKKTDRDGEQESRKETTAQEKTTGGESQKKTNSTGERQQKTASSETRRKTSSEAQRKTSNSTQQRKTSSSTQQRKTSGGTQQRKTSSTQQRNSGGETQSRSGNGGTTQAKSNGSEARKKSGDGTVKVRDSELKLDDRAGRQPRQEDLRTRARFAAASDPAPRLAATEWTRPSREEVASTNKPRSFAPNPNAQMTLSARALGLYDMPVTSSDRREDLDSGLVHVPETSRPWDEGTQKNVFIAGHYLGAPQTQSRLAFYNLHKLKKGDELVLEDGRGQSYKYRVSEMFAVKPGDSWTMGEVRDRDMVTLQTCIPPDFGKRLMVRADRVRA